MHDLSTIMAMNRRAERNRNIYRAAHDEDGHARLVRVIHTTPGCRTVQDGTACTCTREDDQRYHHAKMDRNTDKPNPDDYPDEPEEVSRDRGFIHDINTPTHGPPDEDNDPERHCKACECTCSYCDNPVTSCVDFGSLCDPCKIEIYGRLRDADERQPQIPMANRVRIDDADAFTIESYTPLDEGDLFTYDGKALYASTIILIIEVRKYPTDQVRAAYNTTETITRGMPAGICLDCNNPFADRTDRGYLTCESCRPC